MLATFEVNDVVFKLLDQRPSRLSNNVPASLFPSFPRNFRFSPSFTFGCMERSANAAMMAA